MKIRELAVHGAREVTPQQHGDPRGLFLEWYRADKLDSPLEMMQANMSISSRGVLRGIHYSQFQAKYVTCVRGSVVDVMVDLRVGSPTFRAVDQVVLDDMDRRSIYIPPGVGHGFCALTDDATLVYMCSSTYDPVNERAIHPLDPDLGINWPLDAPHTLSTRDQAAPSFADAILPRFQP